MKSAIKFSIVIPLYNKEECIAQTLRSVLSQTYSTFELIVVNDGSTDNSSLIVSTFNDERIRLVNKTNGGVSSARNKGIELARNEYIAFLDADDYWDEHYLDSMVSLIRICPEAKMFASSYAEVIHNKRYPAVTFPLLPKGYIGYVDYVDLFSRYFVSPINSSAVVIHFSLFKEGFYFNENIKSGEDLLVWLGIAFQYRVAYSNEILSFYNRDVNENATGKLCPWEKSFIFVIKDLLNIDSKSKLYLVNGLILKGLRPYYAFRLCSHEAKALLASIDLQEHNLLHRLFYSIPICMIKAAYCLLYYFRGDNR